MFSLSGSVKFGIYIYIYINEYQLGMALLPWLINMYDNHNMGMSFWSWQIVSFTFYGQFPFFLTKEEVI